MAVKVAKGIATGEEVSAVHEGYNEKPPGEGGSPGRWSALEECRGT